LKVEYGVIVVDLFGKATAMADEYEPREVPVLPEPPVAPAAEEGAEPSASAQDGQAAAEAGSVAEAGDGAAAVPEQVEGVPAHDAHNVPTATYAVPVELQPSSVQNGIDHAAVDAVHADSAAEVEHAEEHEVHEAHDAHDAHDAHEAAEQDA